MQVVQESPEQIIARSKALDAIIAEHEGHEQFTDACRFCIFNAAHSVQRRDIAYTAAFLFLSKISLQVANDAIREVSTALDDHELVTALPVGGLKV